MPRGQKSEYWTPEMRAKISAARKGVPGHKQTEETRKKIGVGARNTRNNEKMSCPYACGMISNNGAIARHVKREHEFQCLVSGCNSTVHKGRGLCSLHHGIDIAMRRYDLTVHDYLSEYSKQNGLCLTCFRPVKLMGTPNATRAETVTIDHCHTSGIFRGLICQSCNLALGHIKDNVATLERMILYLRGNL